MKSKMQNYNQSNNFRYSYKRDEKKEQINLNDLILKSDIKNDIIENDLFSVKDNINKNNTRKYIIDNIKERKDKYITISDIIGEKCKLNIDILRYYFHNYEPSKTSKKKMGLIKSYAVNTYQGIVRNYNEDRVSIIVNMNKPRGYYKKIWPRVSFFGIFDGHGGETCSEYLRDNLHDLICHNNNFFPENIPEAIKLAFEKAEKNFIEKYALNKNKEMIDKSGSCAVILLIVDNKIYVANVGDSRCLLSKENCKKYIEVTKDHKPNDPNETSRIKSNGGKIYQTETLIKKSSNIKLVGKKLIGPYRVFPGGLSVSRTIGDVEAKLEKFGGNSNVVISKPDIFVYDLNKDDIDFFILGCDGIFDQLSSEEVINCAWSVYNNKDNLLITQCKDIHKQSGIITDLIMKSALARKSFDNVTCLFISFKEIFNNNINNNITKENNKDIKYILSNSDLNKINEVKNKNNNNNINVRRTYTYFINNKVNINNEIKNKENLNDNKIHQDKITYNDSIRKRYISKRKSNEQKENNDNIINTRRSQYIINSNRNKENNINTNYKYSITRNYK